MELNLVKHSYAVDGVEISIVLSFYDSTVQSKGLPWRRTVLRKHYYPTVTQVSRPELFNCWIGIKSSSILVADVGEIKTIPIN